VTADFNALESKCKNQSGDTYIKGLKSCTNNSPENLSKGLTHVRSPRIGWFRRDLWWLSCQETIMSRKIPRISHSPKRCLPLRTLWCLILTH